MKRSFSLLFAAAVLMLAGCQNTVNTTARKKPEMEMDLLETKNFTTDPFCRARLKCLSVSRGEAPGGLMTVQVRLGSTRYGILPELWSWFRNANPYHVNYRFEWFDARGMQVETAASCWQRIIFEPGESKSLQAVAPDSRCKDFVLSLQEYSVKR